MTHIIEGIDNEITIAFTLFFGAAAIALPWYLLRPRERSRTTSSTSSSQLRNSTAGNSLPNNAGFEQSSSQTVSPEQRQQQFFDGNVPRDQPNNTNSTNTASCAEGGGLPERILNPNNVTHDRHGTMPTPAQTTQGSNGREMTIKIKIQEDNREVTVSTTMTLSQLKRHCFPDQIENGQNVRFIYNGRILQGDNCSLEYLGLKSGCVVHVQISEHDSGSSEQRQQDDNELQIGFLLVPFISLSLVLSWIAVFAYDDVFSSLSITILALLTGVLILLII